MSLRLTGWMNPIIIKLQFHKYLRITVLSSSYFEMFKYTH